MSSRENLKIDHVQIHTASLSIRHFMVSNRKMTLSVFRQIMPEQIINEETMELRGVPWGRVNYFWDGACKNSQGDGRKNIHVVWQKGDDLRRCVVGAIFPNIRDMALSTRKIDGEVITSDGHHCFGYLPSGKRSTYLLDGDRQGIKLIIEFRPDHDIYPGFPPTFNSRFCFYPDIPSDADKLSREQKEAIIQQITEEAKEAIIDAEAKAAADRIEYIERFNRLHASLCDLPQIYIAV